VFRNVYKSLDGGENWAPASSGLPSGCGDRVYALLVDPTDSTVVYAGGNFGDCPVSGGVYKSTDGGGMWSRSLANPTLCLAIDPSAPSILYAGTTNGPYKTTDGGGAWQRMSDGLPPSTGVRALAVDPMTPSTVYAGTDGFAPDSFIAKIGPGGAKQ